MKSLIFTPLLFLFFIFPLNAETNEKKEYDKYDFYAKCFGHMNGFLQVVSVTQSYKQFGNSVVPIVVEKIMIQIIAEINSYRQDLFLNAA